MGRDKEFSSQAIVSDTNILHNTTKTKRIEFILNFSLTAKVIHRVLIMLDKRSTTCFF